MRQIFRLSAIIAITAMWSNLLLASAIFVDRGWNLIGTTYEIKSLDEFLNKSIVRDIRVYRDNKYISEVNTIKTIKANEGFWIYAKRSGTLYFDNDNNKKDDASSVPTPFGVSISVSIKGKDGCHWSSWWDNWSDFSDWKNWDKCFDDDNYDRDDIVMELKKGWNLKGTSVYFRIRDVFDNSCLESNNGIVLYRDDEFYHRDNDSKSIIFPDEGFFVKATKDCSLRYKD